MSEPTMDLYTACAIAEGFCGFDPSDAQLNAAWQYIIDTGAWRSLQGWYGRTAFMLIERGLCTPPSDGTTPFDGATS